MRRQPTAARRAGFTLIELLIVIAIIAVLAGLLLVALSGGDRAAKRAQTATEITSLGTACTAFKNEFKFNPPIYQDAAGTKFTIPTNATDPGVNIFRRMFPRWDPGTGVIAPELTNKGQELGPIECFMYFVNGPEGKGWDPNKPYSPTGTTKKGPFLNAESGRLSGYTYSDIYGTPYAYMPQPYPGSKTDPSFPKSITVSGMPVEPFKRGTRFENADSVQIISAGPNGAFFDKGSTWEPGVNPADSAPGGDDVGNFHGGKAVGTE